MANEVSIFKELTASNKRCLFVHRKLGENSTSYPIYRVNKLCIENGDNWLQISELASFFGMNVLMAISKDYQHSALQWHSKVES
jgi:hypothetical protein